MNILHLEDNDADAELFERMLAREWPDSRIHRLWTRPAYEAALQLENFDLILSDYSMPGFDGLAALEIARACSPETPFIFLSGTLGEDRAIEALKRGAIDYVLKDSPGRFITAVRGALAGAERDAARRRAEESLRRNRERFREIAESIDDFIVLVDRTGRCIYTNAAFLRLIQKNEVEPEFRIFDLIHPEDQSKVRARLSQALLQTNSVDFDFRLAMPDGGIRYVEGCANRPTRRHEEGAATLLLAGRDVTHRIHAEERLKEQASLLEKARDAIWLMDTKFDITQWNAGAERIYKHAASDALERNARELLFSRQVERFNMAVALTMAQGEWQGEFRFPREQGGDLVVDCSWSLVNDAHDRPKSILCIDTDVTHRKQLEQELQRGERLESLGMLASGIAHDLNNVLSPILMSAVLLRPLARTPDDHIVLDTLETSANHGTDLVHQILLFVRGGEGQRFDVHIGRLLDGLEGFLKTVLRKKIELHLSHDPDLWLTSADATQIKQIIVNLCSNARDAMPAGGKIEIHAANVQVEAGSRHGVHGEIPAGPYVHVTVADNGAGIPPAVLDRIFDPFFTTKEMGKGTGLGLSTIAGIVRSHEGAIQVESTVGRGTTFHLYLPSVSAPPPALRAEPPETAEKGHGETVLVIDDDDGIRLVAEKILETRGYTVLVAADGESGLEIFYRGPERVKAVICDQIMPGIGGADVLKRIRNSNPEVGLILMGGLLKESTQSLFEDGSPMKQLPKPVTVEALLRSVKEAVEVSAGAG